MPLQDVYHGIHLKRLFPKNELSEIYMAVATRALAFSLINLFEGGCDFSSMSDFAPLVQLRFSERLEIKSLRKDMIFYPSHIDPIGHGSGHIVKAFCISKHDAPDDAVLIEDDLFVDLPVRRRSGLILIFGIDFTG